MYQASNEEGRSLLMDANVRGYGARGDGTTDDRDAFQRALDAMAKTGGTVYVPPGKYRIRSPLEVPEQVGLIGPMQTAHTTNLERGSVLLAEAGHGNDDGPALITLGENSSVRGLAVHYPLQSEEKVVPYPWTIKVRGTNAGVLDMLLTNPFQAIDLSTSAPRHHIRNLNAQPLYRGILLDNCFDIGKIENVHLWPFWSQKRPVWEFMREHGVAFEIGRCDWEYMTNCFAIFYGVGFRFFAGENGPGNALLTHCGADLGPVAVRVEQTQEHSGVSFSNSQFMAGIEVGPENAGPVKFTACGFWGIEDTGAHAVLEGPATTTFTGCHFTAWDREDKGEPAIRLDGGSLIVNGCDFHDAGKKQIKAGEGAESVIVVGNRLRGGAELEIAPSVEAQVGFNTYKGGAPANELLRPSQILKIYPAKEETAHE